MFATKFINLLPFYATFLLLIGELAIQPESSLRVNTGRSGDLIALLKEDQLTPDPLQQMKSIEKQHAGRIDSADEAVRRAEGELTELMIGDASSQKIREKQQQLVALKLQSAELNFDKSLAIRNVLTTSQHRQLGSVLSTSSLDD